MIPYITAARKLDLPVAANSLEFYERALVLLSTVRGPIEGPLGVLAASRSSDFKVVRDVSRRDRLKDSEVIAHIGALLPFSLELETSRFSNVKSRNGALWK